MKLDIIIAGVGGQGIVSIAAAVGYAALKNNLYMKQAETHGMSQRGGAVQSYMRISDKPIYSDLIPKGKADLILSVEPMEALRYLPYLSETGYLVTSADQFVNIPDYPEKEVLMKKLEALPRKVIVDAKAIAKEAGSFRASNIVMLGAASPFINIDYANFEEGIKEIFGKKGQDIIDLNLKALKLGREFAEKNQ